MGFPDVIRGTDPYSFNHINDAPRPNPVPFYVGQTLITESTLIDDRYNGIWLWIDSATDIDLTFPSTLLAGFNCTIIQAEAGRAFCIDELGNPLNSESGTTNTDAQFSAIHVVHRNDGLLVAMWDGASGGGGGTDYFSTLETLTTGAAPVSINPAVFLTKIVSGGTGGTEVVNFNNYSVDQAGKPHLIVFDTQTNPSDVISVQGGSGILVSPFGALANGAAPSPQFPAVFNALTMHLNAVNDGFTLTWSGTQWALTGQVGVPTVTTQNAFKQAWDGINNGPSVLTQLENNTYALVPDMVSPFLGHTVTASTDINNPTLIPCVPRWTNVTSAGNGGPSYIKMQGVDSDNLGSTLITKAVFLGTLSNPADTVVFQTTGGNIANLDGAEFTSLVFDTQDQLVSLYWDNIWVTTSSTNATAVPPVIIQLPGNVQQATATHANTTVSIPRRSVILAITWQETSGNAVTGGVKIGTTSGATDVVVAQAVGANSIGCIADANVLLKMFSTTAAQTLFIQPVTNWNNAVVNFQFTLANVL